MHNCNKNWEVNLIVLNLYSRKVVGNHSNVCYDNESRVIFRLKYTHYDHVQGIMAVL